MLRALKKLILGGSEYSYEGDPTLTQGDILVFSSQIYTDFGSDGIIVGQPYRVAKIIPEIQSCELARLGTDANGGVANYVVGGTHVNLFTLEQAIRDGVANKTV